MATATEAQIEALIERRLDRRYLVDTLVRLARVPTEVPLGYETLMAPDDPKLVRFVQEVVRPELVALGAYDLLDPGLNGLVVRFGTGESGRSCLLMAYTPSQHANLMAEPFSGKIRRAPEHGRDEPCVFGQGVSQNKAHVAVLLALAKLLVESGTRLRGALYLAINNEGRSSHACSEAILRALDPKPEFGVILIGTGFAISLGNRGRVDVNVEVVGRAAHSSAPESGLSAIDGANEALNRLKRLVFTGEHPLLGGRHAVPYQLRFEPVAPHTLPERAFIRIDRRLLPGDDIDSAVAEIREAIGDLAPYEVRVERGVHMLPALVDPATPGVRALAAAHTAVHGEPPRVVYGRGAFDAGGPCAMGVPTVMYGASGGSGLLGEDFVAIRDVEAEARVLARLILGELG